MDHHRRFCWKHRLVRGNHPMVQEISVQELAEMLRQQKSIVLLDVRLPEEIALCALENSLLIPIQQLPMRWQELSVPSDHLLIVYCHHGVRSWHAAAFLHQQGLKQAVSLQGGIDAWARKIDPTMPRY